MFKIQKSALFMRQWQHYAQDYKNRAGSGVAEQFIAAVEEALEFIRHNPQACALYDTGDDDLQKHHFRKCSLRGFPHMILFRSDNGTALFIDILYAHKMDIRSRLINDKDKL